MSKKEKKKISPTEEPIVLDIPDDEIWTYQVEGLAPPHINKEYKHYGLKKVLLALVIIVAVGISMYFSIRTVQKDTFEYKMKADNTYELSKFGNTGYITEIDIDNTITIKYDKNNPDVTSNFELIKNKDQVITSIREYAFNCDEKIQVINIGAEVTEIDYKSFYSCWALRCIYVDEDNPNYCDIDGVLYNKDKTEIICYPVDHDAYLCEKYGYTQYNEKGEWVELTEDHKDYPRYKQDVLTYVLPSTVTKIGPLAMNYAYLADLYMPEGVKSIETLGLFKATRLENIYTYVPKKPVKVTHFSSEDLLGRIYPSLPEGLEYIGSDALSYNQKLTYIYVPESVTYIGHHAFWDTVYKEDGELAGVTKINTPCTEEEFKNVEVGDSWRPQYDYLLFKKSVDIAYESEREEIK